MCMIMQKALSEMKFKCLPHLPSLLYLRKWKPFLVTICFQACRDYTYLLRNIFSVKSSSTFLGLHSSVLELCPSWPKLPQPNVNTPPSCNVYENILHRAIKYQLFKNHVKHIIIRLQCNSTATNNFKKFSI